MFWILLTSYQKNLMNSKNTNPEVIVRKMLFSKGYRFKIKTNLLLHHIVCPKETFLDPMHP